MAKILLFGEDGQVGWELKRSLSPLGELTAPSLSDCDLTNKKKLVSTVRDLCPDIIVNAAAYTAVDKAETDIEAAMRVNAEAPAIMAEEARNLGALLVDYSTDYVFDGTKPNAYVETDTPNPINIYGSSKLAGLQAIQQNGCRHLIFRVSWVYGSHGHNFVKTMLRLAKERSELKVVADQIGSPIPADFIADITAQAICSLQKGDGEEGLYNLAPAGKTSWCEFAEEIFKNLERLTNSSVPKLFPIETSEYPAPAQRPVNSCLNTEKLERIFGFYMPIWQLPLKRIIEEVVKT